MLDITFFFMVELWNQVNITFQGGCGPKNKVLGKFPQQSGFTQKALEALTDVSRQAIHAIAAGISKKEPSMQLLHQSLCGDKMLKVHYIYHSGFLVETQKVYYIFDYYKGNLPALDVSKPVFVFVSHSHGDHYNPEIFSLLTSMGMEKILAVLSNDISFKKYPSCLMPASIDTLETVRSQGLIPVIKVYHSTSYELPCQTLLQTLLSTDRGVAFLLSGPDGIVYHGGDLNDWITEDMPQQERRQMTGSYLASISGLRGRAIDIAFLPLDPRLRKHYAKGFLEFLQTADVKHACPMHYWDQPQIIEQFLREYPEYASTLVW